MSEAPTPQPDTQPDTSSGLTFFGWCVLGLGLTGLGLSFTVDIGVSVDGLGAVANLDKLSLRELMVQISLGLTLVGTIFASAGHIITAVRTGPLPRP